MSDDNTEAKRTHWAKTRNLTFLVLAVWFIFSFVVHWFAQGLNEMTFIGFPLGYYLAVQGSLAVFVILIFFSNWRQDQIDDEAGFGEDGGN